MTVPDKRYEKALKSLISSMGRLRTGRPTPSLLDGVRVDYYGSLTPLAQVGAVRVSGMAIVIEPWEASLVAKVEKAIHQANLGFNPSNDGRVVRVPVPPLTGELRETIVKQAKEIGETVRVWMRRLRRDDLIGIKAMGLSEDEAFKAEKIATGVTQSYIAKVDIVIEHKIKEIRG